MFSVDEITSRGKGEWSNCNSHPWDGMNLFLMNIHELKPHNQATGLADSSLAFAELKMPSEAETACHNQYECK